MGWGLILLHHSNRLNALQKQRAQKSGQHVVQIHCTEAAFARTARDDDLLAKPYSLTHPHSVMAVTPSSPPCEIPSAYSSFLSF